MSHRFHTDPGKAHVSVAGHPTPPARSPAVSGVLPGQSAPWSQSTGAKPLLSCCGHEHRPSLEPAGWGVVLFLQPHSLTDRRRDTA